MAKKIYISEPKIVAPTGVLGNTPICYSLYEWDEDGAGVIHAPCLAETRVEFAWGEGIVEIRQRVIDTTLAAFPTITSNDIIFLGGWN